MGRIKDIMFDFADLELSFIGFCEALLKKLGYDIRHSELHPGPGFLRMRPDMVAIEPVTHGTIVVEVRVWRSPNIERTIFRNAVAALAAIVRGMNVEKGILIVPVLLDAPADLSPSGIPIEVWDLRKLSELTSGHAELAEYLTTFLRDAEISARDISPDTIQFMDTSWQNFSDTPPSKGRMLVTALRASKPGREAAAEFERLCEEALKLLFSEEFRGWGRQAPIEGGFHRLDLVARLVPQNIFWRDLATDFRTRYVVFEFKNYSAPIGQDQIFTTEKYLFPAALRAIAIIVARNGADEGARAAAKGALRESGKLILIISLDELMSMLEGIDEGEDPHNLLFQRLDTMLTDLGR
jgi:hypothetical protein